MTWLLLIVQLLALPQSTRLLEHSRALREFSARLPLLVLASPQERVEMRRLARIESTNNPLALNKRTMACGLYQVRARVHGLSCSRLLHDLWYSTGHALGLWREAKRGGGGWDGWLCRYQHGPNSGACKTRKTG
jgi:hypothetical protein